jgi:hypothetical protein
VVLDGIRAGSVAALVGGLPSTAYSVAAGRDPLEATLAVGSIVLPRSRRRSALVAAAVPLHLAISIGWAVVLDRLDVRSARTGAVAGLAIAGLDLGLVGPRFPRIRELPLLPQLADHALYGIVVAKLLSRASP